MHPSHTVCSLSFVRESRTLFLSHKTQCFENRHPSHAKSPRDSRATPARLPMASWPSGLGGAMGPSGGPLGAVLGPPWPIFNPLGPLESSWSILDCLLDPLGCLLDARTNVPYLSWVMLNTVQCAECLWTVKRTLCRALSSQDILKSKPIQIPTRSSQTVVWQIGAVLGPPSQIFNPLGSLDSSWSTLDCLLDPLRYPWS